MPPKIRHLQLSLQYAIKLRANRNNPAYDSVYLDDDPLYECLSDIESSDEETDDDFHVNVKRPSLTPSFNRRIQEFAEEAGIPFDDIAQNDVSPVEPWLIAAPRVELFLASSKKADTNPTQYETDLKQVCDFYKGHTHLYTDGSKMDEKVGGAFTWEFGKLQTRIPDGASIFSAEAVALIDALKAIRKSTLKKFLIFTDSLSCLQSIQNEDLSNPLILKFLLKYREILLQGKDVVLCWIPSHVGIDGNEMADKLAKESLEQDIRPIPMPYTDFMPIPKQYCVGLWKQMWEVTPQYLTYINPQLIRKTYDPSLSRKEERALCRWRIGHTRLTHSFRMEGKDRPQCDECNVPLTVRHMMADCVKYQVQRESILPGDCIEDIFSHSDKDVIRFLRDCDLLNQI